LKDGKWSEPKNLGYPINSTEDDVFLTISASGRTAYYSSSNENGMGGQDIYKLTLLGPEKQIIFNTEDNLIASKTESVQENIVDEIINIKTSQITLVKGIVVDAVTGLPVKSTIELIDNQKNEVIATFESNKTSGKYLITLPSGKNYGINVNAEGYLFHSENFLIEASAEYRIVEKRIELLKPITGSEIKLNNIFFDLGKYELKNESIFELGKVLKLLQDYPNMIIEIAGHTDNIGDEPYNLELSTNRAKAVVEYLVQKGISSERMKFIGFGFSKPLASNDTEEGRRQNRRSEIKILSQ
jgi:outer membrane protein OmpA-like peptidoglycan-associated protein